jgi:hypothetical protein
MQDMSEEEVLAFLKAHPEGTAETTPSGLDVSMIRADLKLSPDDRIDMAAKLTNFGLELQRQVRLKRSAATK